MLQNRVFTTKFGDRFIKVPFSLLIGDESDHNVLFAVHLLPDDPRWVFGAYDPKSHSGYVVISTSVGVTKMRLIGDNIDGFIKRVVSIFLSRHSFSQKRNKDERFNKFPQEVKLGILEIS